MDEPLACEVVHPGCHLLAEAQQQLWPLWPRQLPRTERERERGREREREREIEGDGEIYCNIVCIIRYIRSL